jgi:hypothetical protein
MTSPADEVRRLVSRYKTNPARTRTALDALGRSEQADAERAVALGNDGCEVTRGTGSCGDPAARTVLGKRVCAAHADSAADIAGFIARVTGDPS